MDKKDKIEKVKLNLKGEEKSELFKVWKTLNKMMETEVIKNMKMLILNMMNLLLN